MSKRMYVVELCSSDRAIELQLLVKTHSEMSTDSFYENLQHKQSLSVLNSQTTRPVELKKIEITGGEFSDNYYQSLLEPLLNEQKVFSLKDLNGELLNLRGKLEYSGLFRDISINVDLHKESTTKLGRNDLLIEGPVPVSAKVHLTPIPLFKFSSYSSSTDYDAAAGIRYLDPNFLKNASSLLADINLNYDPVNNTLNRKIWDFSVLTPFKNSPSFRAVFNPVISSIDANSWASHTQFSRGGFIGVQKTWLSREGDTIFTNGISVTHRTIGDISNSASDAVRTDAGGDCKIGLQSNLKYDTRKFIGAFALNGVNVDITNELAGFSSVDSFAKQQEKDLELNKFNKSVIKFEGVKSFLNNNFTAALDFNAGSVVPFASNNSSKLHITDRFFLGGLSSLKGFHLNSVGIKNGNDYVGGTSFFKAGFTFFSRIPNTPVTSPLRLYNYINVGDNYNITDFEKFKQLAVSGDFVKHSAISTGVGLAYRANNAVVDLSYNVPLSDRSHDNAKPGLSFSVALNFF